MSTITVQFWGVKVFSAGGGVPDEVEHHPNFESAKKAASKRLKVRGWHSAHATFHSKEGYLGVLSFTHSGRLTFKSAK